MWEFVRKQRLWCLLAPIFMIGEIVADLLQPELMAKIVDKGVLGGDMALIESVGIRMLIIVLAGGVSGFLGGVFTQIASQRFSNDLRKKLFHKIMGLSFGQTDRISTGSLITRISNDVNQVQMLLSMSIRSVVRVSFMFLGGIYMLYRQSARFAFITALAVPFMVFFVLFFMKKASPLFTTVQEKLDGVNNVMQEDITGSRVVKAFVREKYEKGRFGRANDELCDVNLRVSYILAFMMPCLNIILNLCIVAIIYIGGSGVIAGSGVTPGEVMASITYVTTILNSVTFMANIFQSFTRAKASVARINEVLDSEDVIKDGSFDGQTDTKGEIELRGVSFAYPGSGAQVLRGIDLKVRRGETLAILGATGSGKTTLASLIPRFYDAAEGEVLVDGINVKEYRLKDLRAKIAFVMQNTELYSRSIADNIAQGREGAPPAVIKEAALTAQADEFICDTDGSYYTMVTEGGHSLSGGQKQRIAIARAVIKNAEIMIFDDSTSALDFKTENRLMAAMRRDCPDSTKLIIAQRVASVKNADRIALLSGGRIAACGTHEELMKTSAEYREIYDSQIRNEDEDV